MAQQNCNSVRGIAFFQLLECQLLLGDVLLKSGIKINMPLVEIQWLKQCS